MHRLGTSYTPNIFHPEYHPATIWPDLWEMIDTINKEYKNICGPLLDGLVFKNPQGILGMGITEKNNSNWLMRSRVTTGRHTF